MIVIAKPQAESIDRWLKVGGRLTVLSIVSTPNGGSKFLLWSESQLAAALFPASDFNIADTTMPTLWSPKIDLNGYVELSPLEWQSDGFWEQFHDGDPNALRTFERAREAMNLAMNP